MSRQRFQHVETIDRGRVIAHLLDTKAGRHHWVHQVGGRLLEWDRQDAPVKNALLRREARSALEAHRLDQRRAKRVAA